MIFLLSRRLMRDFHAVIGIDRIEMLHGRHHRAVSRIIASQFIGDQPSWLTTLAFDQATQEAHSRLFVAPTLHKNINGIPVLINRAPQIVPFPLDGHKDFVDVPGILSLLLNRPH